MGKVRKKTYLCTVAPRGPTRLGGEMVDTRDLEVFFEIVIVRDDIKYYIYVCHEEK